MTNASKYELSFETRPDYLYAGLKCESMSLDLAKLYIQEVADKCRDIGAKRVIIDRHCPNALSNSMSYLAISDLSELAPPGFSLGIVDGDESNRNHLNFGLRSLERDDVAVQIFATVEEAELWLSART
jgi:hypothetical protein